MNYSKLVEKILKIREPNEKKWSRWTEQKELAPVSKSESVQAFVSRMKEIKEKEEKVFIGGDYDCDGILATTIMKDGLQRFGIECGFYIPDRIQEGYGLHSETVELAHRKGYTTIITVDNGVKAFEALNRAHELGMQTIVTDHHQIDEPVPCDLLVHPAGMESVFSTLCGAAVAYECIRALGTNTTYLLELAAVASIGDMMEVVGQTRALIQQGLTSLGKDNELHLMSLANDRMLNEMGVAFQIVPKLNAIGRLSNLANANNVVRYFLSDDRQYMYRLCAQISDINNRRKRLSEQTVKVAKQNCSLQDDILLITESSFHEGIIGLVAGNLCAEYQKPVIVLTKNQEGYKASMRAPDGFDCMKFFHDFDAFAAFGGHSQAAGFSLDLQEYENFRSYVREKGRTFKWKPKKLQTLIISPNELTISEIESMDILRPFGPGFEMPLFEIIAPNIKSLFEIQNGKHRKYTLDNGLQCMNFNQSEFDRDQSVNSIFSLIGQVQINEYRGKKQAVFVIEKIKYK